MFAYLQKEFVWKRFAASGLAMGLCCSSTVGCMVSWEILQADSSFADAPRLAMRAERRCGIYK